VSINVKFLDIFNIFVPICYILYMISIREAVETILDSDTTTKDSMRRGIVNLSQYARTIEKRVAEFTKKDVGIQSIVVALARIEKKFSKQKSPRPVVVRQLAVQSPIVQLVYPKNRENLQALTDAIRGVSKLEDEFFSFSTSTKDIALIVSEKLEQTVADTFSQPPLVKKRGLSAVSIRFDEHLVREPNIGLVLLQKLASKNVALDAALTTYNEFTLVFDSHFLNSVIGALGPEKKHSN
jgi:hypothetical protein